MEKPVLVYFNPDCFTQVDDTVLHHLTKEFNVVWFYMYESLQANSMRYNPERAKAYADKYGFTLEIVDPKMRRRNLKNRFFYHKVADRVNNYNPVIVYACNVFPFWMYTYKRIKCKNKVLGLHDVSMHTYKFSLIKLWTQCKKEKWIKRFSNLITFSSNQHDLLKQKFGKESYMVGMSYKLFGESKITTPPVKEGLKILFFGIISKYKGLDNLIEVLEQLKKAGINNIKLTIAGRGESWIDCQSLIKTPELYNLQIRFIKNEEIPDLMSSHHFMVLPYRDATQSGPLVTALGYGLPVIAPNYGCFKETLNNESAIIYPQDELYTTMKKVSYLTQSEYDRLKNGMMRLREKYSEEKIADNYINAFNDIIHGADTNY